ncbi:hypothetical protein [Halobacillus litoralis]|uniref:hypothetical protein n=1 Tax=Halobacillus litoralis TaxID=45668 RepID=UPI001CFD29F0|nr:hypothetical protein [Halobacillus litoralis]
MTYQEAVEVLKTIEEVYGDQFPLTKRKVALMIAQLEKMDYEPVMNRLSEHVTESPFPPKLADIAVYKVPENKTLEKMKQWKKEADEVSDETKQMFKEKVNELLRKVSQ